MVESDVTVNIKGGATKYTDEIVPTTHAYYEKSLPEFGPKQHPNCWAQSLMAQRVWVGPW